MGQIMAECDCEHSGCQVRGYCMAEKIVHLEQMVDGVEIRRVRWMNKSDEVEVKLSKAMKFIQEVRRNGDTLHALKAIAVLAELEKKE
jgi:uncharacterized protein YjcR